MNTGSLSPDPRTVSGFQSWLPVLDEVVTITKEAGGSQIPERL
jgi:hypothetical protein